MSACPLFDRVTMINANPEVLPKRLPPPSSSSSSSTGHSNGNISYPLDSGGGNYSGNTAVLERDFYGCYCLKFIVKPGTHITEEKVQEDFGAYGDVVDIRGPGLFSVLRGNLVYVRFIEKGDAERAAKGLSSKYYQLTPASVSDVLPDNYGLYTISFYNKTGIPSVIVKKEFSKFGEVKNLTGSLDVKGGRVFVSYKEKTSAVQALQAFFFRKNKFPNMKFALPRCEKDYFGCYCLKFYNKSGDVTEEKVQRDFGLFGEVVDVRGPGLFDVTGDDVYVRYKDKSSAEQALIELVGKYDSLCLAPPSDIQADKFGFFTITFVNDKCLCKSNVWYIFSKFGTVAGVNGTFDCKKGRVFVSFKDKQGALSALETMLITKEYHLQVSKNSTVRKSDYSMILRDEEESGAASSSSVSKKDRSPPRENSRGRNSMDNNSKPSEISFASPPNSKNGSSSNGGGVMEKFNRNVEKDIFGFYCLSFLNEDGVISEKKIRHDFGKFGDVVSVRGALNNQKGHVFVRFSRKDAAENCLNCLNSFPLSEMAELFDKYLFLSPATPRDIDCDMYGLYTVSFLNLNSKSFRDIRTEFSKFGEILRLNAGAGGNTEELVSISYAEKSSAIKALQTNFTSKEFPYLDIAKGSSLLLVNSSDSSENEEDPEDFRHSRADKRDPFHDPSATKNGSGDVVDELLKSFQSYFSIYRTGQYSSPAGFSLENNELVPNNVHHPGASATPPNRSPDKRYKIKKSTPNRKEQLSATPESEERLPIVEAPPPTLTPDIFGYYSLSFTPPSRWNLRSDEKKLRADFGPKVEKIRMTSNEIVVVSYSDSSTAIEMLTQLKVKYPDVRPSRPLTITPDKDGFFSIEFINAGMNGIREVTEEFSKHGAVMKIQQGGAKNAVKRVTVSYSDEKAANSAMNAYRGSKDYLSVDLAKDCLLEVLVDHQEQQSST